MTQRAGLAQKDSFITPVGKSTCSCQQVVGGDEKDYKGVHAVRRLSGLQNPRVHPLFSTLLKNYLYTKYIVTVTVIIREKNKETLIWDQVFQFAKSPWSDKNTNKTSKSQRNKTKSNRKPTKPHEHTQPSHTSQHTHTTHTWAHANQLPNQPTVQPTNASPAHPHVPTSVTNFAGGGQRIVALPRRCFDRPLTNSKARVD